MENDANGVALTRTQAADAVTEVDLIGALGAFHRTIMHGEGDGIALAQQDDLARLCMRGRRSAMANSP
jgi:hypothetical protein